MTPKKNKSIILLLVAVILLILVVLQPWEKTKSRKAPALVDLRKSPIYSTYVFPKDEKIINFGIQPMFTFAGSIAEVMDRDSILRQDLEKLDLEIRFHAFLKGQDVNFFVKRGDLQGGMCGDMPVLTIAADVDVIIPAITHQGFGYIVAHRHMLLSDFKGKRIAYPEGSLAHYLLLAALTSEGLNEEQVDLVAMDIDELPRALANGKIEAFAAWQPVVSTTLNTVPGSVIIHGSRSLGFVYFRKDFADRHPDAVRRILAAEIRAIRWVLSNNRNILLSSKWAIQRANRSFRVTTEISPAQFADSISKIALMNLDPIIPQNDVRQNGHLHREFDFLKSLGKIPPTSRWDAVRGEFNREIIKQILREPKRYRLDEFRYEMGEER